jgi:hypothetical protein
MQCPHCLINFHDHFDTVFSGKDRDGGWVITRRLCPECKRLIFMLGVAQIHQGQVLQIRDERLLYPKSISRALPSDDVPPEYRDDYIEACAVLSDSPKASAALSRRCLQNILQDVAQVRVSNLADEIQEILNSHRLPSHLAESIDAVRNIGNFAAHPLKSSSSGEVLPVEPGEAEWSLDVLESLFDFFFVQPAILKRKRDLLNSKLADAGKSPMKFTRNDCAGE